MTSRRATQRCTIARACWLESSTAAGGVDIRVSDLSGYVPPDVGTPPAAIAVGEVVLVREGTTGSIGKLTKKGTIPGRDGLVRAAKSRTHNEQ